MFWSNYNYLSSLGWWLKGVESRYTNRKNWWQQQLHFSLTGDTLVATVSGEPPEKVTTLGRSGKETNLQNYRDCYRKEL